jgi:hypothetical protein
MAKPKNRKNIINDDIAKSLIELDNSWGYDDDCFYGCHCDDCEYYSYKWQNIEYIYLFENKDGKMVDIDSISIERKRDSKIREIFGELPSNKNNTIGDFYEQKNRNI